ncbi:hypothetical protein Q5P01_004550 [Channa striata]|uniref:Uncharacterized protein n=1 Tax=Channa striata TaxID=64152 RepID=A0AA88NGI4_CHASR|nr:hypothetical protein Q5P01_004550 [Channa striata]
METDTEHRTQDRFSPSKDLVSAMNQSEDRQEGVSPFKITLRGEHQNQSTAQSFSCVSSHTDCSKGRPVDFKRGQKSDDSRKAGKKKQDPPGSSCLSMKSDWSKGRPVDFKQEQKPNDSSCVSMKSDWSKGRPVDFKQEQKPDDSRFQQQSSGQTAQQHKPDLDWIFMILENNIMSFVRKELKKFQEVLNPDYKQCSDIQSEAKDIEDDKDEENIRSCRESFVKITVNFLRRMKQDGLADCLQNKNNSSALLCKCKLKSNLKKKFQFKPEAGHSQGGTWRTTVVEAWSEEVCL